MRPNKDIRLVFDHDGVISGNNKGDYANAPVYEHAVRHINKAYDMGYYIVISTARYGLRHPGSQYQYGYEESLAWLRKHGVKFHELRMGKPAGDLYIDDKGVTVKSANGEADWVNNFWPAVEKLNGMNQYGQSL